MNRDCTGFHLRMMTFSVWGVVGDVDVEERVLDFFGEFLDVDVEARGAMFIYEDVCSGPEVIRE